MKSMQEKYENDAHYHQCVSMMEKLIHDNQFTPSEMREMATLACIHYEYHRTRHLVIKQPDEVEEALKVLDRCVNEGAL